MERSYSEHYTKYKETTRLSQKKYYDNNSEKLKKHVRDYYHNNPEFRNKKIIQMREYRLMKKVALQTQ